MEAVGEIGTRSHRSREVEWEPDARSSAARRSNQATGVGAGKRWIIFLQKDRPRSGRTVGCVHASATNADGEDQRVKEPDKVAALKLSRYPDAEWWFRHEARLRAAKSDYGQRRGTSDDHGG